MIKTHRTVFHCFHCSGRIWKLVVFTVFWRTSEQNSQKIVKTVWASRFFQNSDNSVSFQILPKQWQHCELPDSSKAVTTVWASRYFQSSENSVSFQILPKQWQQCELPDSSKTVTTVWASRFFQNSENSVSFQILPKQWQQCELPDSSKTVHTVTTVLWVSLSLSCHVIANLHCWILTPQFSP
jgi:hypothetical protein